MPKIENKSEEQKVAEAGVESFRKDLGPFVVAAETTRMPMVFTDAKEPGHPIIFANDSFLSLTGYDREEVLGHRFSFLMARGADPKGLAQVEAAFAGGTDHGSEIRYRRKDGSMFWAAIFISPVRDEAGEVVQHFASFVDLTKQKQEQAQSTMMINELNHRVKNTLATVQSIVWQALRSGSDPKVIRESIESRLFALSRSHDLLTRENWEGAGLLDLVNEAMEPFGVANGRTERLVITGKNIRLPPNVTLALGIAFHELATNAVKYGAFSNEAGSILLAWTIEPRPEGDRLILCWQEKDGPPVTPPTRKGFGSRVIERGLPHELQGTVNLDYRGDGMVCTINIPAPRVMNKLLSGRHVLVVEDEMLTLMIIEDMLADLGCDSVTAAATIDQALALIGTRAFDAALLDMNLNGNKSHNVADALAARGVPFVFSTGYSTLDMRDDYRNRPVLKKPFPYEELVEIFKQLLPH